MSTSFGHTLSNVPTGTIGEAGLGKGVFALVAMSDVMSQLVMT
jgi:hypothetical protein